MCASTSADFYLETSICKFQMVRLSQRKSGKESSPISTQGNTNFRKFLSAAVSHVTLLSDHGNVIHLTTDSWVTAKVLLMCNVS